VYSAASALGNASADKSKLQIDSAPILAIGFLPFSEFSEGCAVPRNS
jgi:hypothetical protein